MSDIKIMNFKRVEVVAESKKAAIDKINKELFHVQGDATQAYKIWLSKQVNGVTDRDKKAFMLDYLANKGKNCPGAGYIICVEPAIADTRERPYKINNVKNGVMDALDDEEYSGSLVTLLQAGMDFVRRNSKKAWRKTPDNRLEYPE